MSTWLNIREAENLREHDNLREIVSYAIQSQYSSSKRLLFLAETFQSFINIDDAANLFYTNIVNIYAASGVGLDWWGRILGIGRVISDGSIDITLEDDYYRLLLLYKAAANIAATDAASLNSLLKRLIDTGIAGFPTAAYVLYVDTMVIRWVFESELTEMQLAVFKAAGTLARGAGVGWELYAITPANVFGFDGQQMRPFNQAPFAPDDALRIGE